MQCTTSIPLPLLSALTQFVHEHEQPRVHLPERAVVAQVSVDLLPIGVQPMQQHAVHPTPRQHTYSHTLLLSHSSFMNMSSGVFIFINELWQHR